jgi:transcription-repair coupling factor (superfamily II helicase)
LTKIALRKTAFRHPYLHSNQDFKTFEDAFPYTPTDDQEKSFKVIEEAMCERTSPMDILLCGDVGFGKTEVAMRAIYRAVLCNKQVRLCHHIDMFRVSLSKFA